MSRPYKSKKRYRVGQVVNLDGGYQKIAKIEPWPQPFGGCELTLANGDKTHEKWVKPLTKREAGTSRRS